jgi:hypothetical protein
VSLSKRIRVSWRSGECFGHSRADSDCRHDSCRNHHFLNGPHDETREVAARTCYVTINMVLSFYKKNLADLAAKGDIAELLIACTTNAINACRLCRGFRTKTLSLPRYVSESGKNSSNLARFTSNSLVKSNGHWLNLTLSLAKFKAKAIQVSSPHSLQLFPGSSL